MGLMFFPRGGSAQVTRYLAGGAAGARVGRRRSLAGSLGGPGRRPARRRRSSRVSTSCRFLTTTRSTADDPLLADPPMHPSFEDRPGAPDRVFANVDDDTYEHLVEAWIGHLERAGAADADLLHLHHLTPLNEAAARAFPDKPVVGHLHGTELLMLREIELGLRPGWAHADAWVERMRRWAARCRRLFVLSPDAAPARARPARDRPGEDGRGAERVRPGCVRPPAADARGAPRAVARVAGRRARAAGPRAASPAASPTASPTSRRSAGSAPSCSTSAATRR